MGAQANCTTEDEPFEASADPDGRLAEKDAERVEPHHLHSGADHQSADGDIRTMCGPRAYGPAAAPNLQHRPRGGLAHLQVRRRGSPGAVSAARLSRARCFV